MYCREVEIHGETKDKSMNQWIAKVFGNLITVIHLLVLGVIIFAAEGGAIFQLIAFVVGYLLFVGLVSVVISINERLGEIRDSLKGTNETNG